MKKNKIVILLAVVALLLASLACNAVSGGGNDVDNTNSGDDGFSVTTANITNAHMARDIDDLDQSDVFSPSDPTFYCFFDLNNAPDSTVVKGVWTLVSAEGYESNSEIDSAEVTGSDDYYYFSLDRSTDAWPVGTYKIDLYIDGSLVETLEFEVQ
jgi:predicted small secreted protein